MSVGQPDAIDSARPIAAGGNGQRTAKKGALTTDQPSRRTDSAQSLISGRLARSQRQIAQRELGMRSESEIRERMLVFGPLGPYLDAEFSDLLSELLYLLREYGIGKLQPDPGNSEQFFEFVGYVHEGWKQAHSKIASRLSNYIDEIEKLEKEKKLHHAARRTDEKKSCIRDIEVIKVRMVILRRFYDSIAWMFLRGEHSSIRRFVSSGGVDNLSRKNIEEAEAYLESANGDPLTIAISSDMTTFIHTGDVLQFNAKKGVALIELKSGDKNMELYKAANFAVASDCPHFMELYTSDLNEKDSKHFHRARKQIDRANNIVQVINNGTGKDNNTGDTVSTPEPTIQPESYSDVIVRLYKSLSEEKTWALDVVDECLYVGVYSDRKMAMVGFNSWIDGLGCSDKAYNILSFLKDPLVRPLPYFDLPTDLLDKILRDEVIVALCLDIPALIYASNKRHPNLLSLMSKTESAPLLKGWLVPLSHDGQVVKFSLGEHEGWMGSGLLARIIFDFQRPLNVVEQQFSVAYDAEASSDN